MRFCCLILALASLITFINGSNRCQLPKDEGTGSGGRYSSFYYDTISKRCKNFFYRGQGGNANKFNSLQECRAQCICGFPLDQGTNGGAGPSQRYYHKNGQCLKMNYKGSGGNRNNFPTLEECQKTCLTTDQICELKYDYSKTADSINCLEWDCVSRFHFNKEHLQCTRVYFLKSSGAEWNGNNFKTKEECESKCACRFHHGSVQKVNKKGPGITYYFDAAAQKCQLGKGVNASASNNYNSIGECNDNCVCTLPADSGFGKDNFNKIYFDPIIKQCKPFTYRGQGGNGNRFHGHKDCNLICGCRQDKDEGTGSKPTSKVYYDKYKQRCYPFTYNGQGGNENRFATLTVCSETCGVCDADPMPVPKAQFTHFFYDKKNKLCKKFGTNEMGYGANNFRTENECKGRCACLLPHDVGYGSSTDIRAFYDKQDGQCKDLHYKGNGGNANNFATIDECKGVCACGLPKEVGAGSGNYKRYHFDIVTETCDVFYFKGHAGNGNNFKSLDDCNKVCKCNLPKNDGDDGYKGQKAYFNSGSKTCEWLSYGYEGGNANRFKTKQECQNTCV